MKLNLDKVPSNLNEAIKILKEAVDEEEKEDCKDPVGLHFGFGMWLRNNWSLWDRETVLVQWFIKNLGIAHADDISGTILEGLAANVLGEPFNPQEHVKRYKEHWEKYGIDPITQLPL